MCENFICMYSHSRVYNTKSEAWFGYEHKENANYDEQNVSARHAHRIIPYTNKQKGIYRVGMNIWCFLKNYGVFAFMFFF